MTPPESEPNSQQDPLRIGVPSKGRLAEHATELLNQAGMRFRRQNRALFARVSGMPIEISFLRTDDIPVLCAEGAIDMGITGSDLVDEAGVKLETCLELGVGKCRLAVCVPEDADIHSPQQLDGLRIATSFPHVTKTYLEKHNAAPHLVSLSGSVEVMISLGVADAIVDLVETGSTLAANRLRIMDTIGSYQTVLVRNSAVRNAATADLVTRRLEGVVIARAYSLVEYNVPRAKLAEAEQIAPGFNSPTVTTLEDPNWCSVRVMVPTKKVSLVMDQLEQLGAAAILETQIANCRL